MTEAIVRREESAERVTVSQGRRLGRLGEVFVAPPKCPVAIALHDELTSMLFGNRRKFALAWAGESSMGAGESLMGKKSLMQRVISALVVALAISLPALAQHKKNIDSPRPPTAMGWTPISFDRPWTRKASSAPTAPTFSAATTSVSASSWTTATTSCASMPGHGADALITHSFQGTFNFNYGIANLASIGFTLPVNLVGGDPVNNIGPPGALYNSGQLNSQSFGFFALHAQVSGSCASSGGSVSRFSGKSASAVPTSILRPMACSSGHSSSRKSASPHRRSQARPQRRVPRPHAEQSAVRPDQGRSRVRIRQPRDRRLRRGVARDRSGRPRGRHVPHPAARRRERRSVRLSNEVVGGIKLFVERNSYLMLGAGVRTTDGFQAADLRAVIGFIFEPSIGDRDGDGYKDDVDKCPDDPEDFDGFEDADGCPDPDNDKDGILDVDDKCPNNPEDRDGVEDEDGCPEGSTATATATASSTRATSARTIPRTRTASRTRTAAPTRTTTRTASPTRRTSVRTIPRTRTASRTRRLPRPRQRPRRHPRRAGPSARTSPRPTTASRTRTAARTRATSSSRTTTSSSWRRSSSRRRARRSLPESNAILDAVATTIIHHPEFTLIEVQGHADERSDDDYNLRLTNERAHVRRGGAGAARGAAHAPAIAGLRRVLPARRGSQRRGVGEEPPRRVQGAKNARRSDRRRARVQASS